MGRTSGELGREGQPDQGSPEPQALGPVHSQTSMKVGRATSAAATANGPGRETSSQAWKSGADPLQERTLDASGHGLPVGQPPGECRGLRREAFDRRGGHDQNAFARAEPLGPSLSAGTGPYEVGFEPAPGEDS